MSQRTKPVKIPRKCINKMGVLNVQRCNIIVLFGDDEDYFSKLETWYMK